MIGLIGTPRPSFPLAAFLRRQMLTRARPVESTGTAAC